MNKLITISSALLTAAAVKAQNIQYRIYIGG